MPWSGRLSDRLLNRLVLLLLFVPSGAVAVIDGRPAMASTWLALGAVAVVGIAFVAGSHRPLLACLLLAEAMLVVQRWGQVDVNNAAFTGCLVAVFIVGLRLGETPIWSCAVGVAALTLGLQLFQTFNPLAIMLTAGPCAVGRVLGSRRRLAARLAERAEEIARERVRFTEEAVRYERARIARELHDIVAHCVSLIVVQAGAGQRLTGNSTAEFDTFDNIAAAVVQAQTEIDLLVGLLASGSESEPAGLELVSELVERARATGMTVTFAAPSQGDAADASTDALIYRIVREGLTNAIKHAPGAAVSVDITRLRLAYSVTVTNGPSLASLGSQSLGDSGGGFGIAGMRERVVAVGGELLSIATSDGGWSLSAQLPIHAPVLPEA